MATGNTELFEAARAGDRDGVLRLIDAAPGRIAARDDSGASLLHVAAESNDAELARALLEVGADPGAEASWGQTPFEWAANLGSFAVAHLLRERDAGRHTLWTAAALGLTDEVRTRLDDGGPDALRGRPVSPGADLSGWPEDTAFRRGDALSDALYIACRNGHLGVARQLLAAGGDPRATGYFGASAIHWAAIGGHADVVRWLSASGADLGARDPKFGATPEGWAREGGHLEIASHLASHASNSEGEDIR